MLQQWKINYIWHHARPIRLNVVLVFDWVLHLYHDRINSESSCKQAQSFLQVSDILLEGTYGRAEQCHGFCWFGLCQQTAADMRFPMKRIWQFANCATLYKSPLLTVKCFASRSNPANYCIIKYPAFLRTIKIILKQNSLSHIKLFQFFPRVIGGRRTLACILLLQTEAVRLSSALILMIS